MRNYVRRDFLPDPLGSVSALPDSSQSKTESASHGPNGGQRGTSMLSSPFGCVGTFGYDTDDTDCVYVRARTLLAKRAMWLTVDPFGPSEEAFGYAEERPTSLADPSGLDALIVFGPDKRSGDRAWRDLAMDYARRYKKRVGKPARVVLILTYRDLAQALETTKDIDTFIDVGHAGVPSIYRGPRPSDASLFLEGAHPEAIDIVGSDIASLPTTNVQPGAFVFLAGCGTAAVRNQPQPGTFQGPGLPAGVPSLAKRFATRFNTPAWGFAPHRTPGPVRWWNRLQGPYNLGADHWRTKQLGNLSFDNGCAPIFPTRVVP